MPLKFVEALKSTLLSTPPLLNNTSYQDREAALPSKLRSLFSVNAIHTPRLPYDAELFLHLPFAFARSDSDDCAR
jgi:hypothetical protein